MHFPFNALAQGKHDYQIAVIKTIGNDGVPYMTVCATEEAVYITKEQAMKFFGLVDPTE